MTIKKTQRESDEFIVRLGESKQDKLNKEFSMLHDETSFEIIRKVGPEAFAMYYTLNSYTRGNSGVMAFPKNDTLAQKLNVSARTVQRWKSVLIQENILRAIPCHLDNGTQTSNVILLNAAYPEIPDDWFTYGADGFTHAKGQLPKLKKSKSDIIMRKIRVKHRVTNLSGYQNMGRQNCHGTQIEGDKTVTGRVTKLSSSPPTEISDGARADGPFFDGEPYVVEPYKKIDIYDACEENSFKKSTNSGNDKNTLGQSDPAPLIQSTDLVRILNVYTEHHFRPALTFVTQDQLTALLNEAGVDLLQEAMEKAIQYNACNLRYVETVVDSLLKRRADEAVTPAFVQVQDPQRASSYTQKPSSKPNYSRSSYAKRGLTIAEAREAGQQTVCVQPDKYAKFNATLQRIQSQDHTSPTVEESDNSNTACLQEPAVQTATPWGDMQIIDENQSSEHVEEFNKALIDKTSNKTVETPVEAIQGDFEVSEDGRTVAELRQQEIRDFFRTMQAKKTVDKPKMHMLDADQEPAPATQQGKYARFYALYEQDQRMRR